jgi:hypothetical protein
VRAKRDRIQVAARLAEALRRGTSILGYPKQTMGYGRTNPYLSMQEPVLFRGANALAASTRGWHEAKHDLRPWLSYFLGVLTAAYREFEPRAEAVTAGRGSKAGLVKSFVRSNLSDAFTFADVKRASPGVSDDYIRQVLRELRDAGIIEGTGAGRGAGWRRLRPDF